MGKLLYGELIMKVSTKIIIPLSFLIFIGIFLSIYYSVKGETINNYMRNNKKVIESIAKVYDTMKRNGNISTKDISENIIYFDPDIWYPLKYTIKGSTTRSLAIYCMYENSGGLSVEVKDLYSGEILATYSDFWGTQIKK